MLHEVNAVPVELALDFSSESLRQKELYAELFRLFLEARIYTRTLNRQKARNAPSLSRAALSRLSNWRVRPRKR